MKKKFLSLILAAAMAVSVCACGNTDANKQSETANSKEESKTAESVVPSSTENEEPREHVELVVYAMITGTNPGKEETIEAVNEYLKEKLSTTVDYHFLSWSEYDQVVTTMVSSGSYIDILYTGQDHMHFPTYAPKNAFAPIEDYVDEYLSDVKELVPESSWDTFTVDGHLYGVPLVRDFGQRFDFTLNTTMADDLGLTFPEDYTTFHDLVDFFYEAKEARDAKYPEKANQPIVNLKTTMDAYFFYEPIVSSQNMVVANMPGLTGFDGMGNGETVFCPYLTEDFREYAKLARQMVEDGILPVDGKNFDPDNVLFNTGELIGGRGFGQVFINEDAYMPYWKAKLYPSKVATVHTTALNSGGMAVAATSKHVERSLEVINLINTDPYLATVIRFGPEGIGWTDKDNNNVIEVTELNADPQNTYYYNWYGWWLGGLGVTKVADGYPENFNELLLDLNNNAIPGANIGFMFNSEPVENEIAACANVVAEFKDVINYGQNSNVDKLVDEFVDKLKANGIEKIVNEAQNQLDAWRAANITK